MNNIIQHDIILYHTCRKEYNFMGFNIIIKYTFWNCLPIRGPRLISEYIMTELFSRHISLQWAPMAYPCLKSSTLSCYM